MTSFEINEFSFLFFLESIIIDLCKWIDDLPRFLLESRMVRSDQVDHINANMSHNGVGSDISIEAEEGNMGSNRNHDEMEESVLNSEMPCYFRGLISRGEFMDQGKDRKGYIEDILKQAQQLPTKHIGDFVDSDDAGESNEQNIVLSVTTSNNIAEAPPEAPHHEVSEHLSSTSHAPPEEPHNEANAHLSTTSNYHAEADNDEMIDLAVAASFESYVDEDIGGDAELAMAIKNSILEIVSDDSEFFNFMTNVCFNSSPSLSLVRVEGDGNCMFTALMETLHARILVDEDFKTHILRNLGETLFTPMSLRQLAVEELRHNNNNQTNYEGDFIASYKSELRAGDIVEKYFNQDYNFFVTDMGKNNVWGDEIGLRALSNVLKIQISILTRSALRQPSCSDFIPDNVDIYPTILLVNRDSRHFYGTKNIIQAAALVNEENSDGTTNMRDISSSSNVKKDVPIKVHLKSMDPYNEYLQNDEILFGCFWFILGHQYVVFVYLFIYLFIYFFVLIFFYVFSISSL